MTARILSFLLLISTLVSAQNLPDAPKPKPPKPAQRLTFISTVERHKKPLIIGGFVAAAVTATVLMFNQGPRKTFKTECACPAKVPRM